MAQILTLSQNLKPLKGNQMLLLVCMIKILKVFFYDSMWFNIVWFSFCATDIFFVKSLNVQISHAL